MDKKYPQMTQITADVETGFKPVSTKNNVSIISADTYALYGLTEEEIAVVGGKGKGNV